EPGSRSAIAPGHRARCQSGERRDESRRTKASRAGRISGKQTNRSQTTCRAAAEQQSDRAAVTESRHGDSIGPRRAAEQFRCRNGRNASERVIHLGLWRRHGNHDQYASSPASVCGTHRRTGRSRRKEMAVECHDQAGKPSDRNGHSNNLSWPLDQYPHRPGTEISELRGFADSKMPGSKTQYFENNHARGIYDDLGFAYPDDVMIGRSRADNDQLRAGYNGTTFRHLTSSFERDDFPVRSRGQGLQHSVIQTVVQRFHRTVDKQERG
ncbi:hypothetical protein DAPPUDRAFT_124517, partial [Daphnia pulex]